MISALLSADLNSTNLSFQLAMPVIGLLLHIQNSPTQLVYPQGEVLKEFVVCETRGHPDVCVALHRGCGSFRCAEGNIDALRFSGKEAPKANNDLAYEF
jgi:hypothetical protein